LLNSLAIIQSFTNSRTVKIFNTLQQAYKD